MFDVIVSRSDFKTGPKLHSIYKWSFPLTTLFDDYALAVGFLKRGHELVKVFAHIGGAE